MQFRHILSILAAIFLCACGNKEEEKKPGIQALSAAELTETKARADKGDAVAQLTMGRHHIYGLDENNLGKRDERFGKERAFRYLNDSAQNGTPEAMLLLSRLYRDGYGTDQDDRLWESWLVSAVKAKAPHANLCYYYFLRIKNRPKHAETLEAAMLEGDAEAQYLFSEIYSGKGEYKIAGNYAKAFEFALSAAKQGHAGAQYTVAGMYEKGQGVPRDIKIAIDWARKSALQGDYLKILNYGNVLQSYAVETKDPKALVNAYALWIAEQRLLKRKLIQDDSDTPDFSTVRDVKMPRLKALMTIDQCAEAERVSETTYFELENGIRGKDRFLRDAEFNFLLTGKLPKLN